MGDIVGDVLGDFAPGAGGALGGAASGAMLGSFIPGIGTLAGAIGGGLFGGLTSMGSANAQEEAIKKAYETQNQGLDKSLALQKYMFDLQRSDLGPQREALYRLLPQAEQMATDYTASPLFKLQMNEGTQALDRLASSRGLYGSGAALENQRKFIEGLTAREAENKWGRLANLITGGGGAVSQGVGAAGQYGVNAGNLLSQSGQNMANLALAQGQARTGLYQGLQQLPFNALNAYSMYNAFGGGGGGGMFGSGLFGGGGGMPSGGGYGPNPNSFSFGSGMQPGYGTRFSFSK